MRTTDLKDLLDTVEAIRVEFHPEIDSMFLAAVVEAEESNPDDEPAAVKAIEKALKECLARKEGNS